MFSRVHISKVFLMSAFLAVMLSFLAFWPQSTEDSSALDLNINISTGETFRFDDTYPGTAVTAEYDVTESSSVVGTIFMPFDDDGITWSNQTFITRSGTGVSASGGTLTGAGFDLSFGSPYGESGTFTIVYKNAGGGIVQTTTINFTIVQPEIQTINVNGQPLANEGDEYTIEQGGEVTVEVAGTSNFRSGGVSIENQDDNELLTIDILVQSGTYESVTELGPFFFAQDPVNSQTFGPFTVLITNTSNVDPGTYPIYIRKTDADDLVPTSTFFNLTVNEPATFCGDTNVDEPNDAAEYEFCDNGGLCPDNTTVCNAHADCIGTGGDELCTPRSGDSCDENCLSEYFLNLSFSSQYCAPGETITGSYSVSLPAATDELALTLSDESGFAPFSDEIYFTDVTINGGSPASTIGTQAPFSFPTNSGTIFSSGVSTVEFEIYCDTLSSPWHLYLSGVDTDLAQNIGGNIRSLPIDITNTPPVCGNSSVEGIETCDDGGESATCDVDCTAVSCGDGTTNTSAGETCDDGVNNGNPGSCNATCDGIEPAAPSSGGGAASRGRVGDRNTFGDDEEELSEDGIPEVVVTGEEISSEEYYKGSAKIPWDAWSFSFGDFDLGDNDEFSSSIGASFQASNWIENQLLYGSVPGSADEIDESLDEPIAFPFGIGYPSFRDQLRLEAHGGLDVFDEQPFTFEVFDVAMTAHESVELTAALPFELVAQLYKENLLLVGSVQMLDVRPESAEGWEGVVIGDQMERVENFRLSLEATYADIYEDEVFISPIPNAVDCPSCAVHFSLAVTMYRQYLLPLEILYSDLLCDASMSEGDKNAALRIVLDNIDQAQRILEHYLENYAECRAAVDEEFCPVEIDLEALAPETMDEACVEEPVYEVKEFSEGILGELDESLSKRFREYRRANNRTSYDLTQSLNF